MLFVLILLYLIVITSTTGSWHQLDGSEYYIDYTAVIGVDKAKEGCKAMNAILAVVKSQRIQDFLVKNIGHLSGQPYSFYIGLSRINKTTLQWSDGTILNLTSFTYWAILGDQGDNAYDPSKLCVTMGWEGGLNGYKWKIVECERNHRYICQKISTTTNAALTTTESTTALLTSKQATSTQYNTVVKTATSKYILITTSATMNNASTSGKSAVVYAMIGVGASVVLLICGIIYIKYYRNNKSTTDNVNKKNSGSEEGEGPVVVDNVLYGTSAEPIQDLYEEAGKVDPVYSCADASASYVVPNVEFDPKAAVYDCTPDNASTENDQNETDDNSREDSLEDVYAQVVKKKKT